MMQKPGIRRSAHPLDAGIRRRVARCVLTGGCAALLSCVAAASALASPELTAEYRFQNALTSSVGSAPALTNIGPESNSFATDAVDGTTRTVLTFPFNNGLRLSPTTGVIPNNTYTAAVLFRFTELSGYRRILDFKNSQADSGLYLFDGHLNFYPHGDAEAETVTPETYALIVLTRDSSGQVVGYVDGSQQLAFDDSESQDAVIDENNALGFFRDNEGGSFNTEASPGAVACVLLYNGALTSAEVAALRVCSIGGPVPTVTKVKPTSGPVGGGTRVTITGTGFAAGATTVSFGSSKGTAVTVTSATSLTVVSPGGPAGTVDVRVTTPSGTSPIVKADHFKFAPKITGLVPNGGSTAGGTIVTVTGTGFGEGSTATTFKFGTVKGTGVNCPTSEECTVTSPAHAAGKVAVTATVNKATSAKSPADVYTYS